jgi:hypothetical protein
MTDETATTPATATATTTHPEEGVEVTSGDGTTTTGSMIKLISRDDVEYRLPLRAALLSKFVGNSLGLEGDVNDMEEEDIEQQLRENNNTDDGTTDGELKVEVLRVSGRCLEKIVAFMEHHYTEAMEEISMPLPGPTFDEVSCCYSVCVHQKR